jgi:antitoxin MazE
VKVAKWGNSLAVRLPADVVKELGLKEGDHVELEASKRRKLNVMRKPTLDELFEKIEKLRGRIPADFKFDRDEANER